MSSVKLDLSKMLGYKILSNDDAAASVQDAAQLGAKLGTKVGAKVGEKVPPASA